MTARFVHGLRDANTGQPLRDVIIRAIERDGMRAAAITFKSYIRIRAIDVVINLQIFRGGSRINYLQTERLVMRLAFRIFDAVIEVMISAILLDHCEV